VEALPTELLGDYLVHRVFLRSEARRRVGRLRLYRLCAGEDIRQDPTPPPLVGIVGRFGHKQGMQGLSNGFFGSLSLPLGDFLDRAFHSGRQRQCDGHRGFSVAGLVPE